MFRGTKSAVFRKLVPEVLLTLLTSLPMKSSSFTDPRDSRTYTSVRIGEQVWMAENCIKNNHLD